MKIYTRKGDSGRTGLFGGGRVAKDDLRVEAFGAIDELNSVLGRVVLHAEDDSVKQRITRVQSDLFAIGAILATPAFSRDPDEDPNGAPEKESDDETEARHAHLPDVPRARIAEMERWIDEAAEALEPLKNFVLPGGSPGGAELHIARAVCRRAERRVVALAGVDGEAEGRTSGASAVDADLIRYLNRLSDLLFTYARLENERSGRGDILWRRDANE